MKKFLAALLVSALFFAVSCGGSSSEKKEVVEEKSEKISAEKGGEIEVSDGAAKIKIPAGALAKDTEISVKLYKTSGFNNKKALASNVVEFGPSGTVFQKPLLITINAEKSVSGKTIAAAVMKSDGSWSFSKEGAAVKLAGFDESGDPIMTSASGDPIMTNASGDPIMSSASGDPIMMSASGDPIMVTASGNSMMSTASGDPIMMTTGHFSSYTFVVVDEVKEDSKDNGKQHSGDVTCKTIKEWDTLYDDAEDNDYNNKEDSSIYCQKTGEMLVYCLYGDFYGSYSDIYSIKVGSKEFKCESENNEDCVFGMEQYCGHFDGEYEDGYYCEEQGTCENTGETAKACASTKGDGNFYYQVGDKKFDGCTSEDVESCYNAFREYCGETIPDDEEEAEEIPEECYYYMYCESGDFDIYRCTPEDDDIYIYMNNHQQECDEPEEDMEKCDKELALFSESCSSNE